MSVVPFVRCEVFDPEEVELMGDVFEDILGTLHLPTRDDVLAQVVATRIIQLAKGGERNPERMRSAACRECSALVCVRSAINSSPP